jgi:hypothetical protein
MCQQIALEARDMHRQGTPIATIRENIRAKYAHYEP